MKKVKQCVKVCFIISTKHVLIIFFRGKIIASNLIASGLKLVVKPYYVLINFFLYIYKYTFKRRNKILTLT